MTDAGPSVALLFDDGELVAQLRDALHACGARIVHEGGVAGLNRRLLQQVDADVLVINLDDAAADALNTLYALIEGDRPRIVFNDAAASAALTGWDRARWARHLAVKVFQVGDTDPPRPVDARSVEVPTVEQDGPASAASAGSAGDEDNQPVGGVVAAGSDDGEEGDDMQGIDGMQEVGDMQSGDDDAQAAQRSLGETEALSAELEALLASAELMDSGASGTDEDAGMLAPDGSLPATVDARPEAAGDLPASPSAGLDDLLSVLRIDDEPGVDSAAVPDRVAAPAVPSAPAEWALVGDDAITPEMFGVEKQAAAEFLAPDAEKVADDDEPVMNLELVSMEEAIAPRPAPLSIEMHLDELQMALSHLVLTGATLGGTGAAVSFYAALPASTQLTFLHTQHLGGQSVIDLVAQLAKSCSLVVTLAASGASARPGEILVVPPGHAVRIRRDAQVEVRASGEEVEDPSIDESLKMASEIFGRDAIAIVFSGHSTDSIAGAKAIHAGGGRIWVETAAHEYADLVHEISAAQIVDYSGTPEEMAAHLMEQFA